MKKSFRLTLGLAAALAFASGAAQAQLLDSVKGALGGSSSGSAREAPTASSGGSGLSGLGNLGSVGNLAGDAAGLGLPSLASAGTDNVAGLLQFCVKNNYLSGNAVENVQEKLLGSLGGQKKAESNPDFLSGLQGKVLGSDGSVDLSGGGFKEELTRKVCDQVLEHAGSLI